jgi:hypothetical protein
MRKLWLVLLASGLQLLFACKAADPSKNATTPEQKGDSNTRHSQLRFSSVRLTNRGWFRATHRTCGCRSAHSESRLFHPAA